MIKLKKMFKIKKYTEFINKKATKFNIKNNSFI